MCCSRWLVLQLWFVRFSGDGKPLVEVVGVRSSSAMRCLLQHPFVGVMGPLVAVVPSWIRLRAGFLLVQRSLADLLEYVGLVGLATAKSSENKSSEIKSS